MAIDYKKIFAEAKAELAQLRAEEANLEEQLLSIRTQIESAEQVYNTVAPVVGEPRIPNAKDPLLPPLNAADLQASGLTVAIRSALDERIDTNFSAAQMRDHLTKLGWDWIGYKNPLSTVHTTLVRLAHSGMAREVLTPEGKKAFHSANRKQPWTLKELGGARSAKDEPSAKK
ncbi:MAG TPA: hypothetical protein VG456_11320 [Candidatus Sulfopaludibacter sp.]|jgi:hypothetical protein|nr:hypothetical protein [Candidatus Sulfopaludibacter sp.]